MLVCRKSYVYIIYITYTMCEQWYQQNKVHLKYKELLQLNSKTPPSTL